MGLRGWSTLHSHSVERERLDHWKEKKSSPNTKAKLRGLKPPLSLPSHVFVYCKSPTAETPVTIDCLVARRLCQFHSSASIRLV
jgi:hypothetical protein